MSWLRIKAILALDLFHTRRSMETMIDLYFFSLIAVVTFGLVTRFLAGSAGTGAQYLLLGIVMWEVVRIAQYSMTVSSMWIVWSSNLSNIFVSPITLGEYIAANVLGAIIKTTAAIIVIGVAVAILFHLDIWHMGPANLLLFYLNLSVFAWSLGLALLGLIFCFGVRIQALAWGTVFLFEPLCAALFPLSQLPGGLRPIANAFPATHVFEAARASLTSGAIDWNQFAWATGLNVVYGVFALWVFRALVRRSQRTGQFTKNGP